MDRVCEIINAVKSLSEGERARISDALLKLLNATSGVYGVSALETEKCRACGSEHIVKFGRDKNGKQRYKCKSCGTTFTSTSHSAMSHTRHSEHIWETYIQLLLKGASLRECAYRCGISVRTAFIWRHKILSTLQMDQDNRVMAGIVEADEMFVPVSYKGNHTKSRSFIMPRKSYKRGTDNRSNTVPKACVMYAVERNGQNYGEVLGLGQPTIKMVTHAFSERIAPDSIMLSDRIHAMKSFFDKKADIELIQLQSTTTGSHCGGRPEIRGIYHIQTVNNLHKRFRDFLRGYLGVATKYLNNYVNLFIWIENHKLQEATLEDSMKMYINTKSSYIPARALLALDMLPSAS